MKRLRDWWERNDADPAERTESTGQELQAATNEEAASGSADQPTLEAAQADETASTSADQPTLQAAQGGSAADVAPTGPTRERGVYGEDDPRRSGDEDPTLDDKVKVDLSDTAPDGTLLRQGLTDVHEVGLSRSQDLGGGLPEGTAMPGADRLSGMMDPLGALQDDAVAAAIGGRGGGVDPRLAAPGAHQNIVDAATNLAESHVETAARLAEIVAGDLVRSVGFVARESLAARTVRETAKVLDAVTGETTPTPMPPATETPPPAGTTPPAADTTPKPADTTPKPADTTPKPADPAPAPADPAPAPADPPPKPAATTQMPAFDDGTGTVRHVENVAWLDPNFGLDHPSEDPDQGQEILAAVPQRPPGGGYTDPPPPEVAQPMGVSNSNPLDRDPGYVDPAENTDDSGLPQPISEHTTGVATGGPVTDAPADGLGPRGPRNAATGGPAAQGSGTSEPPIGAPGAAPPGSGEVAVTEDEPQYGRETAEADPLGVDTAAAAAGIGSTDASATPQGQAIGPAAPDGAGTATLESSATVSAESGQAVPPPAAPPGPAPDLSGANLQSVDGAGGLPSSGPGIESSPPGAPAQPGADGSEEQPPSSSGDDGMP